LSAPAGLFGSVKALLATVVAAVHDRVELFSTEFQEEMARLVVILVWSLAAVLCVFAGLSFVAVTVLLAVDDSLRTLTAGILALIFVAAGAGAAVHARRLLAANEPPFDASRAELRKDLDVLRDDG
jgi:uncharacterized membrane protein YqjE